MVRCTVDGCRSDGHMIPLNQADERVCVVQEARTWVGTPYRASQGLKGVGCDCAWLLLRVYSAVGLISATEPFPYKPGLARLREGEHVYRTMIERFAVAVQRAPIAGDIVVFRVPIANLRTGRQLARATHGGIVTRWPQVVHAYQTATSVVEADVTMDTTLHLETVYSLRSWENGHGRQN